MIFKDYGDGEDDTHDEYGVYKGDPDNPGCGTTLFIIAILIVIGFFVV